MPSLVKTASWEAEMSRKRAIHSENAPAAIGPYSQALEAGGMVFCSGQIALIPQTGELHKDGVKEQTEQVMHNLEQVLIAAGGSWSDVVKTTIYLTDLTSFQAVNEAYGDFLRTRQIGDERLIGSSPAPARATVEVSALPKGAAVEIDAIAHLGD